MWVNEASCMTALAMSSLQDYLTLSELTVLLNSLAHKELFNQEIVLKAQVVILCCLSEGVPRRFWRSSESFLPVFTLQGYCIRLKDGAGLSFSL